LNRPHEGVEGRAGVALPKVGGGKPANEAVNAEAAHGLVAKAEAGVGVTAHDETPPRHNRPIFVESVDARPHGFASAARKDAEVVGILEVFGKHNVVDIK
jgi:hypothetical protein